MQIWGYEADASCFKALLCGSLQHGDLDTAARLISDAQDRSRSLSRESLELFFLQAARRGRGELAKPILEEAQRAGVLISERIVNSVHRACWHSTSQELASVFWLPTCPSGCCTVVLTFWFCNFSSHPHCFPKCPVSLSFILPAAGTISPWSCQRKKEQGWPLIAGRLATASCACIKLLLSRWVNATNLYLLVEGHQQRTTFDFGSPFHVRRIARLKSSLLGICCKMTGTVPLRHWMISTTSLRVVAQSSWRCL